MPTPLKPARFRREEPRRRSPRGVLLARQGRGRRAEGHGHRGSRRLVRPDDVHMAPTSFRPKPSREPCPRTTLRPGSAIPPSPHGLNVHFGLIRSLEGRRRGNHDGPRKAPATHVRGAENTSRGGRRALPRCGRQTTHRAAPWKSVSATARPSAAGRSGIIVDEFQGRMRRTESLRRNRPCYAAVSSKLIRCGSKPLVEGGLCPRDGLFRRSPRGEADRRPHLRGRGKSRT